MNNKVLVYACVAGAAALGLGLIMSQTDSVLPRYEEPDYEVLREEGDIEIRQYPKLMAAEVELEGSNDSTANKAFRILAGYIFGKNVSEEKIAMTVPVTEYLHSASPDSSARMTMHFYMPSKYKSSSLPEANDKRIRFLSLPSRRYAVVRFSGLATEMEFAKQESRLRRFLTERGISAGKQAIRAFYNPPWTLPFLRRNELWIELD